MARINVSLPIRFECQQGCANCCKINGGLVVVSDIEVKNISKYLNISQEDFLNEYTLQVGKYTSLIDKNETDCIFLEDNKCSVYPVRPIQCRTFPFWPQNLKTEKRWLQIKGECPGIGEGKEFKKEEIEEVFKGKPVDSIK